MLFFRPHIKKTRSDALLAGLHFAGAFLIVVFNALFSAVNSPLGREISAGESPGFAWIRANITTCIGFGLVYLSLVNWTQIRQMRRLPVAAARLSAFLICVQVFAVAAIALMLYWHRTEFLAPAQSVLLIAILFQGIICFFNIDLPDADHLSAMLENSTAHAGVFMTLLFIFGAAIAFLDPSRHRLADQIVLDTNFELFLNEVYPSILSGITGMWLGIILLVIAGGLPRLFYKIFEKKKFRIVIFLTFLTLVSFFMGFVFATLYFAMSWQIDNLHQNLTVWQLFVFLSAAGAVLLSSVFGGISAHWVRSAPTTRVALLIFILIACAFTIYAVLFGDIFNPWFTAFSYLKGAILKTISAAAAVATLLLIRPLFSLKAQATSSRHRAASAILAMTVVVGFIPFYALKKYPEVKVAVLQFNELARVDTALAREFAGILGFGKWINLGQRPPQVSDALPWPQPWRLVKTHPSRLPQDFNLLIIVVDALRGDAFHSAGYHRNLTAFLDRWAEAEAISFKRAYSQGGGSFAAFPFLVAGRSHFDLYGPGLYRQNLYFKIAQAEGIKNYMLMKGFGPRHIYPPDLAVTQLTIPRDVSDRRSATADEVFQAAQKAIDALPPGERFLCFLQLMDVHNDLWKKEGGTDFGDRPRDLYDNNLSYIDRALSRFVAGLKQAGIYEKTVILFTSDHGEQFWEHGASLHGHTVYEEEIRIPLILVAHGIRKRFEDIPAVAADMAPTIADLAGYSVEPPYDDPHMGISLVPLILDKERQQYLKRNVVGRASFKRRYFLYRDWQWKLVYFAELDLLQLFNVIEDPRERHNQLNERPMLGAKMEKDLLDYLAKVEGRKYRGLLSNLLKEN